MSLATIDAMELGDCYSDLGLFNPFEALTQDSLLLNLDTSPEEYFENKMAKVEMKHEATVSDESIITDDELAALNIKDLNRKLKERGLPKATIEKLKHKRRTLKNRKYATDCREKKDTEVHTLEKDKDVEQTELSDLEKENEALRNKLTSLKNHYLKVVEFARKNNIQLKPRNVPIDITGASTSEDL